MRLHRLEVQAFGPFAERQRVDFDALAEGGLFLLHGPTGAGKTSVLDAVCFALYGRVPGARATASRLRSDHADADLAPQVVCEFSVGARRFELTRSPAWERPKRRGEGTTEEKAKVVLRECSTDPGADHAGDADVDSDGWRVLTSRVDEVAHVLDAVLGLSLDQFTKLVLLAQGEFAAFLRADAESRRAMLERLFDTERFTQLQSWLRDRQLGLRRRAEECEQTTRDLVARARQAAAVLPAEQPARPQLVQEELLLGSTQPATQPAGPADPAAEDEDAGLVSPDLLVTGLYRHAVQSWEAATARREVTRKEAARARAGHQLVERLVSLQREQAELRGRLAALEQADEVHGQTRRRLRDADRATPLIALSPGLRAAREQAERTAATLARVAGPTPAGPMLAGLTDEQVQAAITALTERAGRLDELRAVEDRLREVEAGLAALDPEVAVAEQEHRSAVEQHAALAGQLAAVRERQAAATAVVGSLDALRQAEQQAGEVVEAVALRDRLAPWLTEATGSRDQARVDQQQARDRLLDLRERRLAGMAAELAERLADGAPCPVCGALDHPIPAPAGPAAVTEADERAEAGRLRRAEQLLAEREQVVAGLTEQAATAAALAGGSTARTAVARHRKAAVAIEALAEAARQQELLVTVVQQAQTELSALAGHVTTTAERAEAGRSRQAGTRARRDELADRLTRALAPEGAAEERAGADPDQATATVAGRLAELRAELTRLEGCLAARSAHTAAAERLATAERAAADAAAEAGFGSLDQALAALLPPDRHEQLQRTVLAHEAKLAGIRTRLEHPEVVRAAASPQADTTGTGTRLELAEADADRAAREAALCEQAVEALAGLSTEVAEHLQRAGPVLREYRLVNDLSRCAEGTGGDNTLRMSLSAYVLAARLEQVAQAASIRLLQMSGGRYTLTHTDAVQRGRGRSGLGLLVVDGWTGLSRDTASLSGGETFYTSLALALGLADVVSAEAGGTAIETLFVDEGFGTLDEQTLEDVMDVLDGLRAGGRAVGLVSHVADLRDRIPAQLEVIRGRDGSVLRQQAG